MTQLQDGGKWIYCIQCIASCGGKHTPDMEMGDEMYGVCLTGHVCVGGGGVKTNRKWK